MQQKPLQTAIRPVLFAQQLSPKLRHGSQFSKTSDLHIPDSPCQRYRNGTLLGRLPSRSF